MVAEAFNEHEDIFITIDFRDGYPHFQETINVVTQWFIWIVSDFLQIVLVIGLLTSGHVVVDESAPELSLGVDGAFPQAEEPLVRRSVDDHMQVIGHHVFIAMRCSNSDFIQCYPLFRIGLPVIGVQIMELEICWPDDGTKPISEWPKAGDMADTRCIATARCPMCFIIFPPTLHLRCMSLLLIVLDVIPQI
jgi:hypothetical protein